ncbi:unnamed protein product [Rangifer tarandus platyrhynchus]|uniref:Uncharacterized protein n=1 Tax=Rangifer tarandus platyrhynchus TaxID=3082113 RepID=A0ABN9A4W2_RANTA|nr:unnamed protein product [Rangifer tarandus platyrhynchus]
METRQPGAESEGSSLPMSRCGWPGPTGRVDGVEKENLQPETKGATREGPPGAETPLPILQAARCRTGRADHAGARGTPVRGEGPSTAMRQAPASQPRSPDQLQEELRPEAQALLRLPKAHSQSHKIPEAREEADSIPAIPSGV